jgi:hypothetical protein
MQEFILQQKISRSILKSYARIANMRKPEKYTLGAAIEESEFRMLRLAIQANKTRTSKRQHYQFELDAELDVLRALVDQAVAPEAKLISPGLHREWAGELSEIGRLLGKWIQSEKAASTH